MSSDAVTNDTMDDWYLRMDERREAETECGSCGAFIDYEIAEDGDLYHDPDEDCRGVRIKGHEEERWTT